MARPHSGVLRALFPACHAGYEHLTSPVWISSRSLTADRPGNIVYTRAEIRGDGGACRAAISFGQISVLPEFQGRGIGGMLIGHTKKRAREAGFTAILIYGAPAYYGRFGFLPAETYGIGTPDDRHAAPLQVLELRPGALKDAGGRFFEDAVFDVDAAAAAEFDAGFPQKEKRRGPADRERFRQLLGMRKPRTEPDFMNEKAAGVCPRLSFCRAIRNRWNRLAAFCIRGGKK